MSALVKGSWWCGDVGTLKGNKCPSDRDKVWLKGSGYIGEVLGRRGMSKGCTMSVRPAGGVTKGLRAPKEWGRWK